MTGPDEAGARPGFESGTGFLLARLGSLATRSWQAFLAGHGLTQTQYATIMVLAERGPLGQHRLARILAVDARNLVAVLDRLAERDLVARATDPADRRRRNVRLTGPGAALAQALEAAAAVARDDFLRALSPQQRGQLNLLLESLYEAHARAPG
jgi:MarR family transcriptional regulator, lower aerobic nicotinate degradation pathway regulator